MLCLVIGSFLAEVDLLSAPMPQSFQHMPWHEQREAKMSLRQQKRREAEAANTEDIHPGSHKLQRMEEEARLEELESRFRARIRQQKVENARILKANQPQVGELILDPIQRHVQRRLVRQREKIHAGLEALGCRVLPWHRGCWP
eukprot:Skav227012  [mRNA]  locus=scaffold456:34973:42354:+ [translate_table: standard]